MAPLQEDLGGGSPVSITRAQASGGRTSGTYTTQPISLYHSAPCVSFIAPASTLMRQFLHSGFPLEVTHYLERRPRLLTILIWDKARREVHPGGWWRGEEEVRPRRLEARGGGRTGAPNKESSMKGQGAW